LYLAAFPSFEYLGAFAEAADSMSFAQPCESAPQATAKDDGADSRGLRIVAQTPGMDATDQQSFIDALSSASGTCLGLIVLGGVFAESVDFSRVSLAGVVCVGPGLAPPTILSEAIATYHDARGRNGQRIAYLQPALVKTVQVAGRLLRTQDSRGVLLLVDPRFGDSVYTEFYPELWSVERIGAGELRTRLANFWQETPAPPRLRGSEEDPLS
jgi:DNA excision repair protein ERCC-2